VTKIINISVISSNVAVLVVSLATVESQ